MTPTAVSQIIEALCKLILGLFLAKMVMDMDFTMEHLEKYRQDLDLSSLKGEDLQAALESTQASQAAAGAIVGVTVGTVLSMCFLLVFFLMREGGRRRNSGQRVSSEGQIIKKLLAIAIPITITSSMASILNVLDAALVQWQLQAGLLMSENESRTLYGNYALALNIYNLPLSLITAVTISVIPAVSAALADKNRRRGAEITISALRMTALLGMPMGMGLFALGEPIMALLYPSSDLQMAGTLLSWLGFVSCFVCLSLVCTSVLQVYGFVYLPIAISFCGGIIKVIANFLLVGTESVGIYGAPMGHLLCFGFCFFMSFGALTRIVPGLRWTTSLFLKPMFSSAVMAGTAWAVQGGISAILHKTGAFSGEIEGVLSGTGTALTVFPAILLAVVVYFGLIFTLGGVEKSDVLMMPKGETLVRLLRL